MELSEVKALLDAALPNCTITVEGEGGHYDITVVGSGYEGLSTLNRQRSVNRVLMEQITSGAIHAVNIKVYTPDEWADAQSLQISISPS